MLYVLIAFLIPVLGYAINGVFSNKYSVLEKLSDKSGTYYMVTRQLLPVFAIPLRYSEEAAKSIYGVYQKHIFFGMYRSVMFTNYEGAAKYILEINRIKAAKRLSRTPAKVVKVFSYDEIKASLEIEEAHE